MYSQTDFAHP